MADLKCITSPIVETKYKDYTTYQGTREQLIEAGLAQDHQFPEGRRRIKYCEEEVWGMEYRAGGTFQLRRMQPIKQNNVLKLVKNHVSHETIAALEYLLYEAKRGEVIGLAYAAMLKNRSCLIDTAGEAYRNPILALGVVNMLSHEIAQRVRHNDE